MVDVWTRETSEQGPETLEIGDVDTGEAKAQTKREDIRGTQTSMATDITTDWWM